MINVNDEKIRQELVRRYLNVETTLEEERLLTDFLSAPDTVLSAEEKNVLLLLRSSDLIERTDISEKKAEEFDRLVQNSHGNRKGKSVAIRWIVSAAAAVLLAVLLLPTLHISRTKTKTEVAAVKNTKTDLKSAQATKDVNETAEEKVFTAGITVPKANEIPQRAKGKTTVISAKKALIRSNNTEPQNNEEISDVHCVSTSELLETIHILSEMQTNDMIITASSNNCGFILKSTNSSGSSETYMLKRSSDGTSIEIKSQPTTNRVQSCPHELPMSEGGRQSQYVNI